MKIIRLKLSKPLTMMAYFSNFEDYNQDIGKYAILIEVGEKSNKIEQALKSVEYLAECITTLNE